MALKSVVLAVSAAVVAGSIMATPAIAETKYNFSSRPWSLAKKFHKQEVSYRSGEPAGTIIINTRRRYLYFVLGNGRAIRYGIGVGRSGFKWSGQEKISRKAEWPAWRPPAEMRAREPDLPEYMPGGEDNPLGARALYLGNTLYRIHGTAQPWTIGTSVSSGCIRLTNENVIDLYNRTKVGAKVVVE
ncbi:MAG: L,D-transpeptidase [Hyphomicrobiales bacterium]